MALSPPSKDDDDNTSIDRTPSLRPRGSSGTKKKKKRTSKKKRKSKNNLKKDKAENDENSNTERHRLQLLYSQLSTLKLPYKKRLESLKTCTEILTNPNCNTFTIKFAINGFKKIFVQQLKDKKFEIHRLLYNILKIFINEHYKVYKLKNIIFLSLLLDHIKCVNHENEQIALDEIINCIINKVMSKDDKQCIAVFNEFFTNGTDSKHQNIKQKSWHFLHIALDQKYNKKNAKLSKKVINCLENGIKHGLNNKTDKIAQENCFKILFFINNQNETDCFHKIYTKYLNDASRKKYEKMYGSNSKQRRSRNSLRLSMNGTTNLDQQKRSSFVGQYNLSPKRMSVNNMKRRDSLEKIKNEKVEKKRKKKKKKKKGKNKEENVEKMNSKENILADVSSTYESDTKLNDLYNKSKTKENANKKKKKFKKKKKKSKKNLIVAEEEKATEDGDVDRHQRHTNLDILSLSFEALNDPNLSPVPASPTEIQMFMSPKNDDKKSEEENDEYVNFPIAFLQNEECKIDDKLSQYLCAENGVKSREFLSILSRINHDINIYEENTLPSVDYAKAIPKCVNFDFENDEECKLNQLSYNLIGCLWTDNDESGCEPVENYLLSQCNDIILNALSVYNQSISSGNVYHARVMLESLLITHPITLMNALTDENNVNIQCLLKNALFRSIHQGNVDSFFLDLLCFETSTKDLNDEILRCKLKIIQMLKKWEFMQYLLEISIGTNNEDIIATKYGTFFIDLVARCASIQECALLFEDCEDLIVDSFVSALLDEAGVRSTWHRVSCGQILISFMDICSRPSIVDPAAAENSNGDNGGMDVEIESVSNCLYPLFIKCLQRLHTHIPKLCELVIGHRSEFEKKGGIKLSGVIIDKPFGQIRAHAMEMLTLSADYAQFECGEVLGKMPISFWESLIDLALLHKNNNLFLCHFRRLIHLSMIFRRRILKHLIVEKKMIDRFIEFHMEEKDKSALHAYVLQMTCDIWLHENEQEDVFDQM